MSLQEKEPSVVVFGYNGSPYARKVTTYLRLLGQDYAECIQPVIMPRPDLSALGVNYRRIPVVAINGQIFCDTHLILKELEKQFGSNGCLGEVGKTAEMQALEDTWENWADLNFFSVAKTIPKSVVERMGPGFIEDRRAYAGGLPTDPNGRNKGLSGVKTAFEQLEHGILADSRSFLFPDRDSPTLADLKSYWVLEFAMNLPGVLAEAGVDVQTFPKTFAWVGRIRSFVKGQTEVRVQTVDGNEAKRIILSQFRALGRVGVTFDQDDSLGLNAGSQVEVVPTDVGRTHPQQGLLVGLDQHRFTLETKTQDGESLLVHLPRRRFEIAELATRNETKL